MKFSARLGDILREDLLTLVIWNFLFVLTCIPLITIGPALAALTHCTCYLVHNDVIIKNPSRIYLDAFKASFKKALPWGLLAAAATLVLGFGLFIYSQMLSDSMIYVPLTAGSLLGLILIWGLFMHLFPAFYEDADGTGRISAAAYCALSRMKKTVIGLIVSAVLLGLQLLMFPVLIPLTLSIGLVFPAICCAYAHVNPPEEPRGYQG